ncbi:MAG: helix-turn-helix transcriptional regulator [Clostridiales bacterium]|jgi:transcriptional regulator with XRE-family HTH domain|nr:helix-turn-helix transcriptional regulator [Clostridiales bacterium]
MSYRKKIGENIRFERTKRNISIDELAEMLGLSTAFIGLIERGQRGAKLSNLIKIADIFGITVNELIYGNLNSVTYVNESKEDDIIFLKKGTISSLLFDLDENELDFVIASIRNLKVLRNHQVPTSNDYVEYR